MKNAKPTLLYFLILLSIQLISAQTQLGTSIEDLDPTARIGWTIEFSNDGRRMVAGAPNASTEHFLGGKVKVYDLVDGDWEQVGQTLYGNQRDDYFGTYLSMSADGSRFAVGVRNLGILDLENKIIVYQLHEGQWDTLGQILTVGDEDWAGASVQMSADGSRIAAFVEDAEGEDVVQAYELEDGVWVPVGDSIVSDQSFRFQSAMAMSADGQTIAVNGTSNSNFWRFKVYRFTDGNWQQLGNTVASSEESDLFAWSISLSSNGNRIAVGAPRANDNGADSGNVTIWEFTGSNWIQVGSNIVGGNLLDQTGYSVSLSGAGNRVAVGDRFHDDPEFNSGRLRVFEWVETDWQLVGVPSIGEDRADFYGQEVVISEDGSTVAAGAPQAGEDTQGQIRVFGEYPWEVVSVDDEAVSKVQIFPNPVQDYLFVDAPVFNSWEIYDMYGRLLAEGILESGAINLQHLLAGVYFIRLKVADRHVDQILIKQQ